MDDYRTTNPDPNRTTMQVTAAPERGSSALWLIVGGILVAVAVIAWLVMGRDSNVETAPASGGTDMTIEEGTSPAAGSAPDAAAPDAAVPGAAAPEAAPPVEAAPEAAPEAGTAPAEPAPEEAPAGN